jgi:hypothetical protein
MIRAQDLVGERIAAVAGRARGQDRPGRLNEMKPRERPSASPPNDGQVP